MSAPTPAARLTMARALFAAFWRDASGPKQWDMDWETCGPARQQVFMAMADAAFATGRSLKDAQRQGANANTTPATGMPHAA